MDEQVVKLLQSIEKLLKTATATSNTQAQGGLKSVFASKAAQLRQNQTDKKNSKVFQTVASDLKDTDKAIMALSKSMGTLNKEVLKTSSSFSTLQTKMARFGASLGVAGAVAPISKAAVRKAGSIPGGGGGGGVPSGGNLFGGMMSNLIGSATGLELFERTVGHAAVALKKLTTDFFALSRIGMGSVGTLKQLSFDAALAGMSLQEYTNMIRENITFASHVGSLENFAKIASASDGVLASMGIFGAEARDLQASLANSNVMVGVSADKLAQAGAQQIKAFDNLRKTTNMTANEFAHLVKSVAENDQTQKELVGLAPAQKQARMAELLSITTTGQKLGLTGKASEELAAALIAQRKETVQSRFEAAGRIMQLGAFTGQGAEAQRAAQLIRKGRGKTAAETEEMRQLLQSLDKASQSLYEAGDFSVQNIIDQLGPDTGQGLGAAGDIMKASRVVENTASAGEAFNKDFGQHVNKFGQAVGRALALFRGWDQSAGPSIAAAVGSALLLAFRGPVLNVLKGAMGFGAATGEAAAGAGGLLKSLFGGLTGGLGGVLSKGLAASAGPLAGVVGALVEMFTGEISDALNPGGGFFNRLGGIVTAFFTAIPNMILDLVGFVFGDTFVAPLKNTFGQLVTVINGLARELFAGIFNGVAAILEWALPSDSGLLKKIKQWGSEAKAGASENWDTLQTLQTDSTKTLSSIAADNQKVADGAVKTTQAATTKAQAATDQFNNVQYGAGLTAGQVLQDAKAILASPQVQVPQNVGTAAVNTLETAAVTTAAAPTAATAGGPDVLAVLNAILEVLNRSLKAEELQTTLLRGRTSAGFTPAEETANRLLKQGMTA